MKQWRTVSWDAIINTNRAQARPHYDSFTRSWCGKGSACFVCFVDDFLVVVACPGVFGWTSAAKQLVHWQGAHRLLASIKACEKMTTLKVSKGNISHAGALSDNDIVSIINDEAKFCQYMAWKQPNERPCILRPVYILAGRSSMSSCGLLSISCEAKLEAKVKRLRIPQRLPQPAPFSHAKAIPSWTHSPTYRGFARLLPKASVHGQA